MKGLLLIVTALVVSAPSIVSSQIYSSQIYKITPSLLDEVHYYVSDRLAAEDFFIEHLAARIVPHPPPMPLDYITFLSLRSGEGTICVSPRGPFAGIRSPEQDHWKQQLSSSAEEPPPSYGLHWLGIRTSSMNQTLTRLEIDGIKVSQRSLSLPHDLLGRAALIEGPDYIRLALVERNQRNRSKVIEKASWGDFGIDHLMLLVKNIKENEVFFRDLFGGKVTSRRPSVTALKVADATIILAEPEALGIKREDVQLRSPADARIRFLFFDITPAVEMTKARGYKVIFDGSRMTYFDQPTGYTIAITFSPDGLPIELAQEVGRTGPRI
ncbi:MAG: VOC family protein [Acidobacteria bacterium]|nr:VOC family protein [Acidobacteriota bacterium]